MFYGKKMMENDGDENARTLVFRESRIDDEKG